MSDALELADLFDVDALLHADHMRDLSLLDLVGPTLTRWLERLLDDMHVEDRPVVEGKVAMSAILDGRVYVAPGAMVEPGAFVRGPCYIGPGAEVRQAAYVRGSVYIGPGSVVGHTTEAKGSVFLDGAKASHFAYTGDSILGRDVNLGAGTKLANLRLDGRDVTLTHPVTGLRIATGLRKLGAILGDGAQTGCNSVLSPGSILMPGTMVLPCAHFVGTMTRDT